MILYGRTTSKHCEKSMLRLPENSILAADLRKLRRLIQRCATAASAAANVNPHQGEAILNADEGNETTSPRQVRERAGAALYLYPVPVRKRPPLVSPVRVV
jgi:hypothetical protein